MWSQDQVAVAAVFLTAFAAGVGILQLFRQHITEVPEGWRAVFIIGYGIFLIAFPVFATVLTMTFSGYVLGPKAEQSDRTSPISSPPTPPSAPPGASVEGRTLARWANVPLDSDEARLIPVVVVSDHSAKEAHMATTSLRKKLASAGFHPVDDEANAALLVNIGETTQSSADLHRTKSSGQTELFEFVTSIEVEAHFLNGKTIISRAVTGEKEGDMNSPAWDASMADAVTKVCKAIFVGCVSE
jgi:hypothetical protein